MQKLKTRKNTKELDSFINDVKKIPYLQQFDIDEFNVNMFYLINQDYENCKDCKGLNECANDVCGFKRVPYFADNRYYTKMIPCEYKEMDVVKRSANSLIKTLYIPKSILESNLDNFDISTEQRAKAAEYAYKFINNFSRSNYMKGLYLHGSYGTGKTYFLGAMANELSKRSISCMLMYFPDLVRELKSSLSTGKFEDIINELKSIDVLMIDDLGGEMLTSWLRDEILGPVLNYRVSEGLPVFISSNLNPSDLTEHFSQTKDETYHNAKDTIKAGRIMNRIQSLTIAFSLGDSKFK